MSGYKKKTNNPRMGRPVIDLNDLSFTAWDQLEALIPWNSAGSLAEYFGVSDSTLRRRVSEHYGTTFEQVKAKCLEEIRNKLRHKQLEVALDGNPAMLVWLGKQYLDQKDQSKIQNTHEIKTIEQIVKERKEVTNEQFTAIESSGSGSGIGIPEECSDEQNDPSLD